MSKALRVLIVEDTEDDVLLLLRELRRSGYEPISERVETADAMKHALLERQWDIVISDYVMPEFSCFAALDLLKELGFDLPFILVSGVVGEEKSIEAMKAGVHDYIMKGHYARLAPAIAREMHEAKVRRERRQALDESRRAHDELEKRVRERTADLANANAALHAEILERKKLEEELLWSNQNLEQRVLQRTDQLQMKQLELEARNRQLEETYHKLEISRDRYSDLFDFAPLGYVTMDNKGIILETNLTGARLLETPRAALIGMPFTSFLRKENSREFFKHLRQCKQANEQVATELAIALEGGVTFQVQLSSVATRSDEGAPIYRTAITDITKLKETQETILRLNRLYLVLSETGKAIAYSTDRETLFREICRVAVEHGGFLLAWIGVTDEESGLVTPVASHGVIGYLDCIRISGRDKAEGRGPTGIAMREGTYYICNDFLSDPCTRPWHKRAQTHGIRSSASVALKLMNGEVFGVLTLYSGEKDFFKWQFIDLLKQMAADISFALDSLEREVRRVEAVNALQAETAERLRTAEELREKERLLLQQSRQAAMGEMLGNIAHQWRQPLNALGLTIQELSLAYEFGRFTKEYLDASIAGAMEIIFQMSQTIDDFRNFYKKDKEKGWFKVNQVVVKTVSLIEANFRERRIGIDIAAAEEMEIKGYPNEYAQVLLNIMMNARDALLERATADPRVTVRGWMEDGRSVVTLADNAGGIGEEIIEKIFDLYFTTKENDLGTGIGLFMSKTIIEKNMGGRLTVRNTADGAEFRIEV